MRFEKIAEDLGEATVRNPSEEVSLLDLSQGELLASSIVMSIAAFIMGYAIGKDPEGK